MNSALYRIRTVLTLLFFTMFLSACFDNKEEDGPISLEIRPSGAVLIPAETRQFTAIAKHKNGNSEDVTSQVNWSSGDIAIATIDTTGLVTGITVGETAISANLNDLSSTTSLFVDPVPTVTAVTIAPLNPEIPDGGTLQMSAMNRYSNGTSSDVTNSITWGTNNSAIATVDANGLVT
ncbi:MAG: Ig-like domain-containing protein, partial [Gammaproteobacteria bacterium]|nr:Ig-like domain-containing protein [Gammaproteobacteria bacterium]